MSAYPAWTPAARPGIVPLRPLGFGTILGRSFAALRHNPRVLLGFALAVQAVASVLVLLGVGGVALASFSRLDTLRPGTDDFDEVMAGSIAATAIVGLVLGLAAGALGVLVQAVVVSEVAAAVVAEKLRLPVLWRRVKPVAWRLIGYTLLLTGIVLLAIAAFAAGVIALGFVVLPVAIALGVVLVLGAIPLWAWLSTKLLLAPATIIMEGATIRVAVVRSWQLTRGRFWPTLGIVVIVSAVFGFVAQVISIPFSFVSAGLSTILTPTGEPDAGAIIAAVASGLLTQAVILVVQSVGSVVQSTAIALIYVDCRMRHEGLDLDLQSYVERRDAGARGLADPYRENVGRRIQPYSAPTAPVPYGPPAPHPHGPGTHSPHSPQPLAASPPPPPVPASPTAPTRWTAPGQADPESPWS